MNTAGQHKQDCPNHSDNQSKVVRLNGWICPQCNRGVSPNVTVCPCLPRIPGLNLGAIRTSRDFDEPLAFDATDNSNYPRDGW
jgi:hypothetical protein